ncbi:MAG: hypothetical protein ACHQ4H_14855 [Ktedonobacterales bacterium]
MSSRQQRIGWFIALVVLTIVCAIGGIELGERAVGIGYLMLIFGLPLSILGLGIIGYSLASEKNAAE